MQRWPWVDMTWIWHDINGCDASLCQKGEKMLHYTVIKCRCTEFTNHNRVGYQPEHHLSIDPRFKLNEAAELCAAIPCNTFDLYLSTSQISRDLTHFSTHRGDFLLCSQAVGICRVWTWMTQAFEHSRVMLFRFAVQPSIQTMTVGKGWRPGHASDMFKLGVESALCRWTICSYLID